MEPTEIKIMRLMDALVDDIMTMSDEEIDAEIREEGLDPNVVATEMRQIVEQTLEKLGWNPLRSS